MRNGSIRSAVICHDRFMDSDAAAQYVERWEAEWNAHDLEAFLACFQEDYESEQPAHPDRAFRGRDQVRSN